MFESSTLAAKVAVTDSMYARVARLSPINVAQFFWTLTPRTVVEAQTPEPIFCFAYMQTNNAGSCVGVLDLGQINGAWKCAGLNPTVCCKQKRRQC